MTTRRPTRKTIDPTPIDPTPIDPTPIDPTPAPDAPTPDAQPVAVAQPATIDPTPQPAQPDAPTPAPDAPIVLTPDAIKTIADRWLTPRRDRAIALVADDLDADAATVDRAFRTTDAFRRLLSGMIDLSSALAACKPLLDAYHAALLDHLTTQANGDADAMAHAVKLHAAHLTGRAVIDGAAAPSNRTTPRGNGSGATTASVRTPRGESVDGNGSGRGNCHYDLDGSYVIGGRGQFAGLGVEFDTTADTVTARDGDWSYATQCWRRDPSSPIDRVRTVNSALAVALAHRAEMLRATGLDADRQVSDSLVAYVRGYAWGLLDRCIADDTMRGLFLALTTRSLDVPRTLGASRTVTTR